MKKICPLCGTENEENTRFCTECYIPLYDLKKEEEEVQERIIREQKIEEQERIRPESELTKVEQEILITKTVNEQQLEILKGLDRESSLQLYSRIYKQFESDKELEEQELDTLLSIQKALGLTNKDIKYDERIKPYIYVLAIKKEGKLPLTELQLEGFGQVILKKGEIVHYGDVAILKEIKTVNLGYKGGSRGISFPIVKGVRYRIGAHRGHVVKEDRLLESSRGFLLVTSQRIFLQPLPGHKPVSIPLNKILSYQCFNNGIEVYKEGREKGYFFSLLNSSSVEIFGLCLNHLLGR